MKDEDIFEWIICIGVAGLIFWGMKSCEDKPKEQEKVECFFEIFEVVSILNVKLTRKNI